MDNQVEPVTLSAEEAAPPGPGLAASYDQAEPDDAAKRWTPPQGSGRLRMTSARFGLPAQVLSDDLKSRITAPFTAVTRKRLRPGTAEGPGNPIDTAKATVPSSAPSASDVPRPAQRPATQPGKPGATGARDARLVVAKIDPWSVMKFSFLVALVAGVIMFVVVALLYSMLNSLGVFTQVEHTVGLVTSTKTSSGSNLAHYLSESTVLGYTMLVGALDIVLITVIATIGAIIYNAITKLTGGIEITLKEAD